MSDGTGRDRPPVDPLAGRSPRAAAVRAALATAAGLAVVAAGVWLVGPDEVAARVTAVDRGAVAAALVAELAAVTCFGLGLRAVLGRLDRPVSPARGVATFFATTFVSNATPFGRAGGNPFSGLVVAWAADARYETGLAAILAVHTVYNLLGVALGVAGAAALAVAGGLPTHLGRGAVVAAGALLGFLAGLALLWRVRRPVARTVVEALGRAGAWLAARLPGVDGSATAVERRVERFVGHLGALAGAPRTLAAVVALGTAGQACVVGSLWVVLAGVGHPVSPALLFVVLPLSWVAAAGPTPGGLGGTEFVLVAALAATTAVPVAALAAAVLVHRLVTFWLPSAVGGGVAAALAVGRE